jgi:hypothetical protein
MHLIALLTRILITRRVPKLANPFSIRFLLGLTEATAKALSPRVDKKGMSGKGRKRSPAG